MSISDTPSANRDHLPAFAIITGTNLLANLINLAIGMYLVRQFTPELYGQITFLFASFGIFRLLATFGMGNRVTLDVARSLALNDREDLDRTFYSLLLLRAMVALILLVFLFFLTLAGGPIYMWVAMLLLPASLNDYDLAALQGGTRSLLIAGALLAQPASFAVLVPTLASHLHSLESVYAALLCSYAFSMVVGFVSVVRVGLGRPRRRDFDLQLAKSALGFVGSSFVIVILQYAGSVLSVYILGMKQLFAQAAQFGVVLNLTYLPVALLQVPSAAVFQARFIRLYVQKGVSEGAAFLSEFLLLVYRLSIGAAVMSVAFAQPIVLLLYGQQYLTSVPVLIILSPIMVMAAVQSVLVFTLMGMDKPQQAIPAVLFQLVAIAGLVVVVVMVAAGDISLLAIAQVFGAGLGTWLLIRKAGQHLHMRWDVREYVYALGVAVFSALAVRLLLLWTPKSLPWDLAKLALAITCYLILMRGKLLGGSILQSLAILRSPKGS